MTYGYQEKEVLMVVKTYPTPSSKYIETVCTAGVTKEGKWIRLYPLTFRHLANEKQFKVFSWIKVNAIKSKDDNRPESYKIDYDSIRILSHLHPERDLLERIKWLEPLVKRSVEDIIEDSELNGTSLAIFRPKEVMDIIARKTTSKWTEEELSKLRQMSFFDNSSDVKLLEKIPYDFYIKFRCDDARCNCHEYKMTCWEINQAYRSYLQKYTREDLAIEQLRKKWLSFFAPPRIGYLIIGTVHRYKKFINIGHFSYNPDNITKPTLDGQMSIFDIL